jgi:hypothetical protein
MITFFHIHKYTQWVMKQANYSRPADYYDLLVDKSVTTIEYTKHWQERHCTICGKVQQKELLF